MQDCSVLGGIRTARGTCARKETLLTELSRLLDPTEPSGLIAKAHLRALRGEVVSFEFMWADACFRAYVVPRRSGADQLMGCMGLAHEVPRDKMTHHCSRDGQAATGTANPLEVYLHQEKVSEELLASEQRYCRLLEAVTTYRYSVDVKDGTPVATYHSPACLSATGYAPEEFASDPFLWINMVHPDDRDAVREHVATVLRKESIRPLEHRIVRKDGIVRWIRDTIIRHVDERGVLTRYDGLIEDITDRKRLERRLQRLLEFAPDAMVVVDREGRIVFANAQTETAFGYSRQELLGRNAEVLVPDRMREKHAARRAEYMAAPRNRMMSEGELVGRRKDGSEFPVEINLSPIETDEGTLVAAAVRDVTAREYAQQTLQANLRIQTVLNALLELSLQPMALEEQLARGLDLLFSVPWMEIESRGAIFLVEGEPHLLVMKAQRGLPDELVATCGRLPFGRCLCGQAAATRQVVFSAHVDESHQISYRGMCRHGHYCVPIMSQGELLGVLNLYLKEGHERNADEERFLTAVANVLAGLIRRQWAEESLRQSEERFDLAVRGSDAGIWDWDLQTDRVYYSPRWKSILGYDEDEIENEYREWEQRLHPEDRERALATIRDYLDGTTAEYELEHRLRHKAGHYCWILARGALVRDRHGKPYRMVGSHFDITQRKQSEQKLREREAELLAAQRIQERLLPPRSLRVPGFDITGEVFAAAFAAGDFFDYLPLSDKLLGIVVADVSGHGVGSALLTASASAHLRSISAGLTDIPRIMAHSNVILCRETEGGHFITLLFACLDLRGRTLHYVNAGHPYGYVLDAAGDVKNVLESNSLPLALEPETQFPLLGPVPLDTGDVVVLVTDGILEAMSPDDRQFGKAGVLETVRQHLRQPSGEIVEALRHAVRIFSQRDELFDDATAVIIKVEPPPQPPGRQPGGV
jgi:PAS domain S-box-containing protein